MIFINQTIIGQYLQVSAPVYQGVYQRDNSNNANIPVSGQVFGFPGGTPGTYKIECITNRLDANGTTISGTSSTTLITNNTSKGYFNGSITRTKGWYSLQIKFTFNLTGYTSSSVYKVGVGDVFIIAGQSNGQGDNGATQTTTVIPEWIVGNNEDWNCRKEFESRPSMTKISGTNRIGPAGNNAWCYGVLGKKISDANADAISGMPVAFFNTCAGGSSVKNWRDGAFNTPTIGYQNGGVQWCDGYISGQLTSYYVGQPYLTLKNTLNWYVPLFGVKGILWHQGEADADNTSTNTVLSRTGTLYRDNLNDLILKSRQHSALNSSPNLLSWMVAKVSYSAFNTSGGITPSSPTPTQVQAANYANNVLNSQGDTPPTGVTDGTSVKSGPYTDKYNNALTGIYRFDNTHFSEAYNSGLTVLANLWDNKINPPIPFLPVSFNRISPKPAPTISISQSGSTYTFSISSVSGATNYCWIAGTNLAPPVNLSSCLSTTTSIVSGSSVKCFIGFSNNLSGAEAAINWISTGSAAGQNCPSCREGAEEIDETYGNVNMKLYPNPTDKDFRVEFDVPEDDTHLRLEFFDMVGNSVKVITDGSHAKGHFTYPITESLPTGASICQLKVGEIFISKKMIRVN